MRKTISASIGAMTLIAGLSSLAVAKSFPGSVAQSPPVERGRYLVGAAGQCSDCHGMKLQGASLDFIAPNMPPIVQRKAPKLAGLPMFDNEAAAAHFLETGELPDKKHARPPMPQYRFKHDDAVAIVTYLKTLR